MSCPNSSELVRAGKIMLPSHFTAKINGACEEGRKVMEEKQELEMLVNVQERVYMALPCG